MRTGATDCGPRSDSCKTIYDTVIPPPRVTEPAGGTESRLFCRDGWPFQSTHVRSDLRLSSLWPHVSVQAGPDRQGRPLHHLQERLPPGCGWHRGKGHRTGSRSVQAGCTCGTCRKPPATIGDRADHPGSPGGGSADTQQTSCHQPTARRQSGPTLCDRPAHSGRTQPAPVATDAQGRHDQAAAGGAPPDGRQPALGDGFAG